MSEYATNSLINYGSNAMKVIANMAVSHISNKTVMAQLVNRELSTEFKNKGNIITYKKPSRSEVIEDNLDITNAIQSTTQMSGTLTLDKTATINFEFGVKELSLTPEAFFKEIMVDPLEKIPNTIDMNILNLYKKVYHANGPAGSRSINFDDVVDIGVDQNHHSVPGKRNLVLGPKSHGELLKTTKGLLVPDYVKGIIREAQLGRLANYQVFMDQNIKTHTQAALSGFTVDGTVTVAAGDTDTTDTLLTADGSGTPAVGDKFTIADVYSVNPMNYQSTGNLQVFTVVSFDTATITCSPPFRTSGAYKTINAFPTNDKVITFLGSHVANIAFTKNAFTLATAPLAPVDGLKQTMASSNGFAITISSDGDIRTMKSIKRMDILYGLDICYPEYAEVLMG